MIRLSWYNFFSSFTIGDIWGILYFLLVAGVMLVILSQNRTPYKALNWILLLILVPPLGLILYFFFGVEIKGKRIIPLKAYRKLLDQNIPDTGVSPERRVAPNGHYTSLSSIALQQLEMPLTTIHALTCFSDGQKKFDALLDDLRQAKKQIHLQYYIFNDDALGHRIRRVLMDKAAEGLEVRVLYDAVGSWRTKDEFFNKMRKVGVQVGAFMPVAFPFLTSKANFRNHRKVVVIDGKIGYVGGMNIADRYIKGNALGQWRDNHFRIEGEAVNLLQNSFVTDWYVTTQQLFSVHPYHDITDDREKDVPAQFFATGPSDQWRVLEQTLVKAMMRAKRNIYIETPYFLPPEALNRAIIGAALAGVDVYLLIPKHSDVRGTSSAMLSYFAEMVEAGVHVYYYDKGFNHSKLMVIDDEVVFLGSANMDFRSLLHNFEISGIVYDADFAKKMSEQIRKDFDGAQRFHPGDWRRIPLLKRIWSSFCRLLAPQL